MTMLKEGPLPAARGKAFFLNEANRLHDQNQLLDFQQEGDSNINKHGVSAYIDGATTVWLVNPIKGQFEYLPNGKIDRNCVNISPPWMDRFDLVFIISDKNSGANLGDYIDRKSLHDKKWRTTRDSRMDYQVYCPC